MLFTSLQKSSENKTENNVTESSQVTEQKKRKKFTSQRHEKNIKYKINK